MTSRLLVAVPFVEVVVVLRISVDLAFGDIWVQHAGVDHPHVVCLAKERVRDNLVGLSKLLEFLLSYA